MIYLYGKGSDISNKKSNLRRAKCKLINQKTMMKLADVAREKGAIDREKAYWNTYHCQSRIITANNRLYAPQCKNRFCTYCSGIRKAELINKYLPVVKTWEDPYFVTLTIKSVKAYLLNTRIKALNRAFRKIKAKHQKRGVRGKGKKLMGLKTIECNFNATYKTYNPHLHLIVPDKATAELLVEEWLDIWTSKFTHRDAQHYRRIENREKDLVEIIKYGAKIITQIDGNKKSKKKGSAKIYVRALDNIYSAMKGCRLIDRFGFSLPQNIRSIKKESQLVEEYQIWQYHMQTMDWLNNEHECTLVAFNPADSLLQLLETHIDTEYE